MQSAESGQTEIARGRASSDFKTEAGQKLGPSNKAQRTLQRQETRRQGGGARPSDGAARRCGQRPRGQAGQAPCTTKMEPGSSPALDSTICLSKRVEKSPPLAKCRTTRRKEVSVSS